MDCMLRFLHAAAAKRFGRAVPSPAALDDMIRADVVKYFGSSQVSELIEEEKFGGQALWTSSCHPTVARSCRKLCQA